MNVKNTVISMRLSMYRDSKCLDAILTENVGAVHETVMREFHIIVNYMTVG